MKIVYWSSTLLVSAMLLWSSYTYFFVKAVIDGVRELGFPDFFRIQLGVLKILAAIVLLIPTLPVQVKEWAYAGVALFFLTALVAHIAHKDSWSLSLILILFLGLLVISNVYFHRMYGEGII